MPQDTFIATLPPRQLPALRGWQATPAHLAYRLGPGAHLFRSEGTAPPKGGLMVVDDQEFSPLAPTSPLCQEVIRECQARSFSGAILDFENRLPPLEQTASQLDEQFSRRGWSLYVTEGYAPSAPHARVMIPSALSGGSLQRRLEDALERFGESRVVLALEKRAEEIREVVTESVAAHQISDVEVGAFLSGGVDSSFIAALSRPDKTYSVGFDRKGFNETGEAQELCKELGLKNISRMIDEEDFFSVLPAVQYYADEPNANLSTVPLYFLSQLAAKDVKVVLSGEGADELFGGYMSYHTTPVYEAYRKLPQGLRRAAGRWAAKRPPFKGRGHLIEGGQTVEEMFLGQAFIFDNEEAERVLKPAYRSGRTWRDITGPVYDRVKGADDLTKKQYLDLHLWQPLDILRKADRMTMAHSLELRVPYLDREVWRVARAVPSKQKMRGKNITKYPLRLAAVPLLPDDWIKREKKGFPVPFIAWLREEKYYNWAKELISQDYVAEFFDVPYLLDLLDQHYSGKVKTHRKLYTVLSFLIWYQVYFPEKCGVEPFRP